MSFRPDEVIFCPTMSCNLSCSHCRPGSASGALSVASALRFVDGCKRSGVARVGFSGGEPFLRPLFLERVLGRAARRGLLFGRLMTNGAWWRSEKALAGIFERVRRAGFDGTICVSVDAFHAQDLRKVATFIRLAVACWRRPDAVSIAYVASRKDAETRRRLLRLAKLLDGRLSRFGGAHASIRSDAIFIRLERIPLSAAGRRADGAPAWDGAWFAEDLCRGPGNVFFVQPDGSVKPCCGYANDAARLTIGSIARDTPAAMVAHARANRFVRAVFTEGLTRIRGRLERIGWRFPGKTSDHCFFCRYLLTRVPPEVLERCV